jgi:hypothetical protein
LIEENAFAAIGDMETATEIYSRQGAKHAKGVWGNNKINIEALCDCCASARDKNKLSPRRKARKDVWGNN